VAVTAGKSYRKAPGAVLPRDRDGEGAATQGWR
jgi:hypothetical protein